MQGHGEGIHTVGAYVAWLSIESSGRVGVITVSPIPVAVTEMFVEGLKLRVLLAGVLVVLLTLLHSLCQEVDAFGLRFKVVADVDDSGLAISSRVTIDEFNDDISH